MANLRIYIGLDNLITAEVLSDFSELKHSFHQGDTYIGFLDKCEEAILDYGCDTFDSIWVDEFQELVSTYGSEDTHPNLWGILFNE